MKIALVICDYSKNTAIFGMGYFACQSSFDLVFGCLIAALFADEIVITLRERIKT